MNELQIINNGLTMTSLEVVDLVNKLRIEEGNDKKKRHDHFMSSIKDEINALNLIGIAAPNFWEGSYIDKQNQERPCFILNKQGIMQMLNKESAYVRYKTQQYIEALENKLTQIATPSYMIEDPIARAERWIEEEKQRRILLEENEKLLPKASKFDNFMDTDGTFGFRELVKHINKVLNKKIKETEIREYLIKMNIICKQGNKYVVSQNGVREGYGMIKDNIVNGTNRPLTRYTDKLRDLLLKEFN